jgi:hypothetical protein
MYYNELPLLQIRFHYASTDDFIFNMTGAIKNISSHLMDCTDAGYQLFDFTTSQLANCASPTDYGMAFMQNLLANVININTIYQ